MTTERPVLGPGLPVRANPPGAGQGLLGPLLIDRDRGLLFALTSAQLVPAGSRLFVARGKSTGACISIGPPTTGLTIEGDIQDCHALVAAVPLGRHELDLGSYSARTARRGANYRDIEPEALKPGVRWMGHFLNIQSHQGKSARARVVSADSQFSMPNPSTGRMVMFDNALELRPLDHSPLVLPGDVGSVVTTSTGVWLGIVVAGRKDVAYVAPIQPIMARLGLNFIGADEMKAYNRRLAAERGQAVAPRPEPAAAPARRSPQLQQSVTYAYMALAD